MPNEEKSVSGLGEVLNETNLTNNSQHYVQQEVQVDHQEYNKEKCV